MPASRKRKGAVMKKVNSKGAYPPGKKKKLADKARETKPEPAPKAAPKPKPAPKPKLGMRSKVLLGLGIGGTIGAGGYIASELAAKARTKS